MNDRIRRVFVWPHIMRIVHGCLILAVTLLLGTGWLLKSGLILNDKLYDFLLEQLHLPAGHLLGLALAVRLFFLIRDDGVSGVSTLLPSASTWGGIKQGLRFYTTFAKSSLPRYFAHHPVWAPLYLVMFALLLAHSLTGLAIEYSAIGAFFGVSTASLLSWHQAPFSWLSMLVILHIASVVLHDLKGEGADVSGMISGYRSINVSSGADRGMASSTPSVALDDIGGIDSKEKIR